MGRPFLRVYDNPPPCMELRLKATIRCADLSNTSERNAGAKGPGRAAGGDSVGQKPPHKHAHPPPPHTHPGSLSDSLPGIIIIMPRGRGDPASRSTSNPIIIFLFEMLQERS